MSTFPIVRVKRYIKTGPGRYQRKRAQAYEAWKGMRARCGNPYRVDYKDYGGRGISICARWDSYENFLADMGEPPARQTLDRIDVDGNYEPSNCRWATRSVQAINRRTTKLYSHHGEMLTARQIASLVGFSVNYTRKLLNQGLANVFDR